MFDKVMNESAEVVAEITDENPKTLEEAYQENLKNVFKKYAGLNAEDVITEEIFNAKTFAVRKTLFESQGLDKEQLKNLLVEKVVLTEAASDIEDAVEDAAEDEGVENTEEIEAAKDIVDDVADEFDLSPDEVFNANGDIEKNLERALKIARREKRTNGKQWMDVCLIGDAGVGKTSRFWTWAHQHPELNILFHDAKTMDELDFKGKFINKEDPKDVKYSAVRSDEFDALKEGEWVLFLDEFNRAKANIRGTLLTLVCDHQVPNPSNKEKTDKLSGLLFTVVGCNPFGGSYNIKDIFDTAEKSRWKNVKVTQTTSQFKDYILQVIRQRLRAEKDEDERNAWSFRYQLADKLLSDSRFHFDTAEEIDANSGSEDGVTNPRSLMRALFSSYDLDDFIDNFEGFCNPLKVKTVEAILRDFAVSDDKANEILNTFNSQSIFRNE